MEWFRRVPILQSSNSAELRNRFRNGQVKKSKCGALKNDAQRSKRRLCRIQVKRRKKVRHSLARTHLCRQTPLHCGREAGVWYFGEGASQLWRALGVGSGRPRPIPRKCARVAYLGWFWFGARSRCCVREACEGGCSCAEDPAIGVRDWCSPVYVYVATLSWSGDPLQSIAGGLSGGPLPECQ